MHKLHFLTIACIELQFSIATFYLDFGYLIFIETIDLFLKFLYVYVNYVCMLQHCAWVPSCLDFDRYLRKKFRMHWHLALVSQVSVKPMRCKRICSQTTKEINSVPHHGLHWPPHVCHSRLVQKAYQFP